MDQVFLSQITKGLLSRVPGLFQALARRRGLQTLSARYCYSVWLRILRAACDRGGIDIPRTVVELGPGSSLGIGLAALLSGVERYYAFDIGEFAEAEGNLKVLDELLNLFENRHSLPGDEEFPEVIPNLEDYRFPDDLLSGERLSLALAPARVEAIRASIRNTSSEESRIAYISDAKETSKLREKIGEPVDFVYSVAVMEHVDDIDSVYRALDTILAPGGLAAHAIDYRSHGSAAAWNGQFEYSDLVWNLIKGKRQLINRSYHSRHIESLKAGNEILWVQKRMEENQLTPSQLAPRFRGLDSEDLGTSTAFVLARRLEEPR